MTEKNIESAGISSIIKSLSNGNIKAAVKKISEDSECKIELNNWLENKIKDETSNIVSSKNKSVLAKIQPNDILNISNNDIVNEVKERAPLIYLVMKSIVISRRRKKKIQEGISQDTTNPNIAMAISVMMRVRCPFLSALAYKISFVLHHSGAKKQVRTF